MKNIFYVVILSTILVACNIADTPYELCIKYEDSIIVDTVYCYYNAAIRCIPSSDQNYENLYKLQVRDVDGVTVTTLGYTQDPIEVIYFRRLDNRFKK